MADWLQGLRLHNEGIDWTDQSLTADILTKRLMGDCSYLKGLSAEDAARKEIAILDGAGYSKWGGRTEWKPLYQHMLTLMKLLMPRRDITLNLADCALFFCKCLTNRRKFLNMVGSQNSGKTSFVAMLSMTCLAVSPEMTAVYVANPFDATADSTVWGEILSVFNEIIDAAPWLWPKARVYKTRSIEVIPDIPKAASIEIRGVKDTGKFKGMKDIKTGKDALMLVAIDEVNEVKSQHFIQEVSNLVSQEGFITITSQNFTTEDNMGGIFCRPKALYDGNPDSYSTLDKDKHQFWHSHLSGVTLRFNGLRSPNILSGRKIYPYLFHAGNLQTQIEGYGEDSPEYYSQVLSFPRTGLDDLTVLSYPRRDSSRWKDREWQIVREEGKVSFNDPSFGGGDKAVWAFAHYGVGSSVTGDGKQREQHPLFWFSEKMVNLVIKVDAIVDTFWLTKCQRIGIDISQFVIGSSLSPEEQLAIQCAELNLAHGISPYNFGFDFSMRPEVTPAMRDIVGKECVAFDYQGGPEGHWIEHCKKDSKEQVTSRNGELAFLVADLFINRQLRGGKFIEEAVVQLCRTKYELRGKKWAVEIKKDYKKRNQGHSPDERDTLMGLVGMAHKRGFRPSTMANDPTGGGGSGYSTPRNRFLRPTRLNKHLA